MAKKKTSTPVIAIAAGDWPMVAVDDLKPHPRNPRQGDVGVIVESIRKNGFYRPLIVQQSSGYILAGNHTWMAARELGLPAVPVCWVNVDDETALRILLVDNRSSDLASYDDPKLASLLQEVLSETGTLEGTGFDSDVLDQLLEDLGLNGAEPEEAPKLDAQKLKSASVADLAPTEEERAILAGRKLLVEYSGGKDSSAAAVWARHYFPDNQTELLFVDMGADFVGFHLYLHDAARFLGVPLKILRSERTVMDVMLEKGRWPGFMHPYCHECLHAPLDAYMRQHEPDAVVILRGGRMSERSRGGKQNDSRWLSVDRMSEYRYFQPLYFSDKATSEKLLEEAGLPAWDGYSRGLCRTACRICPGQKPRAYAAIRTKFPDVWDELLGLERALGLGYWHARNDEKETATLDFLADRGVQQMARDEDDEDERPPV